MGIGQLIDTVKECQYLTIVLKETYHRLIKSREFLIWLISPGVVGAAAIKDISSAITALILWYTLSEREAEHPHYKRSLSVVLRECCRTVIRVCLIYVSVCRFEAILSLLLLFFCRSKLWQLRNSPQHLYQIRIRELV